MLDEKTLELARGPNFASLATVMPDGTLQVHVMWVDADDDHILINTEVHRRKFKKARAWSHDRGSNVWPSGIDWSDLGTSLPALLLGRGGASSEVSDRRTGRIQRAGRRP